MLTVWKKLSEPLDAIRLYSRLKDEEYSILLDSCRRGRYMVLAWDPLRMETLYHEDGVSPFHRVENLLRAVPKPQVPEEAPPFLTGVIGYLGYELAWFLEEIGPPKPRKAPVPDGVLIIPGKTVTVDLEKGDTWVAVTTMAEEPQPILDQLVSRLGEWNRTPLPPLAPGRCGPLVPEIDREEYKNRVRQVREWIRRGDIYQTNLTYRVSGRAEGDPWGLYRVLRETNPGPYAAFMKFPGFAVLSSSPEQFVRWDSQEIETKPIKGTRPRGETPDEDRRLREALAQSVKDRAELVMIVDLERNDLGKFCETGSVCVPKLCEIEPHPTVWHQVASVKGTLSPGTGAGSILQSVFPGGSITGAPKLRSMQIIHGLENSRRGVYTGSIGYIDARGFSEWNIAIRTLTWQGGELSYHVGGGIVWDSDPEEEYRETLAKGRGMARAVAKWSSRTGDPSSESAAIFPARSGFGSIE
ncbi:aminodeoxychorismate synthase component I [Paludifilum halophilum]|uniref:aminodeoxychorismate synthase n=1 Tax=Paludifilum halophilum TaxID=1642702 RepID=A0A235B5E1_9BACL|nr:aminodeoxychorismate synthase component I [Paludifilum halophilum]OYD07452.1 aminodeoxychorismate synthase, component I [Paludifilum halophilum]